MDTPDIIAVVASFVSIAVGVLAIWLATFLYRMSSQLADSAREADRRITTSVERLEKLYDSLYGDSFSLLRDTVSDMRKHIWPTEQTDSYDIEAEIEKKTESKMKELRERFDLEVSELLQRQTTTLDSHADIQRLMSKAVNESSVVVEEARGETIRRLILSILGKEGTLSADDLWMRVSARGLLVPFHYFSEGIRKMRDERLLLYVGTDILGPLTMIRTA